MELSKLMLTSLLLAARTAKRQSRSNRSALPSTSTELVDQPDQATSGIACRASRAAS